MPRGELPVRHERGHVRVGREQQPRVRAPQARRVRRAREYYLEALGLWPGNCGALGYYTELHLQEKNITGAATYLKRMCKTCGSSTDSWDDTQETVAKFDAAVEAEGAEGVVVGDWYGESCLEDGAPRRGAPVVAAVVAVAALWLTMV